jgi:hypothetical protein
VSLRKISRVAVKPGNGIYAGYPGVSGISDSRTVERFVRKL